MKTAITSTLVLGVALAAALPVAAAARVDGDGASPDPAASAAIDAALQGMAVAKLAVSEQYTKTHAWAQDASAAGFEAPAGIPGRIVVAGGTITTTFDAPASIAGKTLRLVPSDTGDGMVHWRCEAGGLPEGLKPKGCH